MSVEEAFEIRPVRPGDAPRWAALRSALWPEEDPDELAEEARRHLEGESGIAEEVFVAEHHGRLVAMAELSVRSHADGCLSRGVAYLEAWYVAPEHRRGGLGRRLIEAAESWGRGRGLTEMASDTEVGNRAGLGAHLACGFEQVATVHQLRKEL